MINKLADILLGRIRIQSILNGRITCCCVVQCDHVRELILLLHQVQLLRYSRVVLEAVLPHLEHNLGKKCLLSGICRK